MPLLLALGILLIIAAIFLPQWWVRFVMKKHNQRRDDFPGTGGELARHLLDTAQLNDVVIEETPLGDHYDPLARIVRLTPDVFHGRSVTAVAIATHEVSHAIQHQNGDKRLLTRIELASSAQKIEFIAGLVLVLAPVLLVLARSPLLMAVQIIVVVILMGSRLMIHCYTLPLEFDASFNKALPILTTGYLHERDCKAAKQVLLAAALTYVAAALATLFDLTRIIRILR